MPLQAQGEFALVKKELESALTLSGQPVKRGTMAHKHIVYMMLADAAAQSRDQENLPRYAALLEELAVRDDHRPYLAVAHRAWGINHRINGEYAEAEESLVRALAVFEEIEARWQVGRTLFEIGELALLQGGDEEARDYFARALNNFDFLKARSDMERTRAKLEALG